MTDVSTVAAASNRLLQVARGGQTRTLAHDAAGNVTGDTRLDGTVFGYGYDAAGRLATLAQNGQPEAAYAYDASGRRIAKTADGVTRHFLHDPEGRLLAEATGAGQVLREYVWLGDLPLAMVADADTASPRLLWFHADHLGTPQRLTDAGGSVVWDAVLEPLREVAQLVVALVDQPLRLPGQYADAEAGLHQNWWRDYDLTLGRYLRPDPLGLAAAANPYLYACGNPTSYVDPTGEIAFVPILAGIGAGYAFDYFLGKYKEQHCRCKDTPLGSLVNSALGGVIGALSPFAKKERGGVSGGDRSRGATPPFSQLNHAASRREWCSVPTRNMITTVARKLPYAGSH